VLPSATFAGGGHNWVTAGQETTAAVDPAVGHSAGHALKVTDAGAQMGQSTTPRLPCNEGDIYYAECWVRLDSAMRDRGVVDIEFFNGTAFLGMLQLTETTSTQWQRVTGYFPIIAGANSFVLRFMPATTDNPARGAGWVDDIIVARVPPDDPKFRSLSQPVLQSDPEGLQGEAPRDLQPTWFPHRPLVSFEDLTGWTYSVFSPATGEFMRSQGMPLSGKENGRLRFACPGGNGWAVLRPPPAPPDHRALRPCANLGLRATARARDRPRAGAQGCRRS
jgi:hypothetical protein